MIFYNNFIDKIRFEIIKRRTKILTVAFSIDEKGNVNLWNDYFSYFILEEIKNKKGLLTLYSVSDELNLRQRVYLNGLLIGVTVIKYDRMIGVKIL